MVTAAYDKESVGEMNLEQGVILGGQYELVRLLGEGSQAVIWEARDRHTQHQARRVVLKIVPKSANNTALLLLDEARSAFHLNHPNIVKFYQVGESQSHLFIAMEYIEGWDLAHLLAVCVDKTKHPIPWPYAVSLVIGICKGLHHAHHFCDEEGRPLNLIHRDVKPNNMLVTTTGQAKLIDFGIAKSTQSTTRTKTGNLKGTPSYMSPEQIRAFPMDARTDLFSLGCTLYELCTGKRPFDEDNQPGNEFIATLMRVLLEAPRPIEAHHALPESLVSLLQRMMAKDPNQRPATAHEVEIALHNILTTHQTQLSELELGRFAFHTMQQENAQMTRPDLWALPSEYLGSDEVELDNAELQAALTIGQTYDQLDAFQSGPHTVDENDTQKLASFSISDTDEKPQPNFPTDEMNPFHPPFVAPPKTLPQDLQPVTQQPTRIQTSPSFQFKPPQENNIPWLPLIALVLGMGAIGVWLFNMLQTPQANHIHSVGSLPSDHTLTGSSPALQRYKKRLRDASKRSMPTRRPLRFAPLPKRQLIPPLPTFPIPKRPLPRPLRPLPPRGSLRPHKTQRQPLRQPTPATKGSLVLNITPPCEVIIGHTRRGRSTRLKLSLTPGVYHIYCRSQRHRIALHLRKKIHPGPNEPIRRHISFGWVRVVFGHSWGGLYYKDFGKLGDTQSNIKLPTGQHVLRLRPLDKAGAEFKVPLTIKRGMLLKLILDRKGKEVSRILGPMLH